MAPAASLPSFPPDICSTWCTMAGPDDNWELLPTYSTGHCAIQTGVWHICGSLALILMAATWALASWSGPLHRTQQVDLWGMQNPQPTALGDSLRFVPVLYVDVMFALSFLWK